MKEDNALLIGAASSGCGKTTFTMGLLRALSRRSLGVQPFKCGPDYIDPLYHRQAAGRESVNLDTFMASADHVRQLYAHYGSDADLRIIEGAMGLYDGYDAYRGSAAEVAMLLDVPVVLLVSARAVAYSVAPLIYGFRCFSPQLRLAGVVFNFVASDRQYATLRQACEDAGADCLGYLGRNNDLVIPSRHLGLTIEEQRQTERLIDRAADEVEAHVDLDRLLAAATVATVPAASSRPVRCGSAATPSAPSAPATTIAVARDEAFNFTYRANIDALARRGRVVFFSPLRDRSLPDCDLLYLPGGYPELFAQPLSDNTTMRKSIRDYAEEGGRVLAECGGFMYLCRDIDGLPMCGVLPLSATMDGARLHLGYRQLTVGGQTLRGHEFHYSSVRPSACPPDVRRLVLQQSATGAPVDTPIYKYKNVLAGYTHWYWGEQSFETLWNI